MGKKTKRKRKRRKNLGKRKEEERGRGRRKKKKISQKYQLAKLHYSCGMERENGVDLQ